jgi:hypothetical protein
MARTLFSISQLAAELLRDRRTVSDALRGVAPDGELRGKPAFYLTTAISVLFGERAGARERKLLAESELREFELQQKRGDLIPAAQVAETWVGIVSVVRSRLLALPSKLAPRLRLRSSVPEIKDIIESEIHSALEGLASTEVVVLNKEERSG